MKTVIVRREIAATQLPLGANIATEPLPRGRLLHLCAFAEGSVVDVLNGFVSLATPSENSLDNCIPVVRNNNDGDVQQLRNYAPCSSELLNVKINNQTLYPAWFALSSSSTTLRVVFLAVMEVD